MLSFKSFILLEALTPLQQTAIGDELRLLFFNRKSSKLPYPSEIKMFSNHLFNPNKPLPGSAVLSHSDVVFDLPGLKNALRDDEVATTLHYLGYKITDYSAGLATRHTNDDIGANERPVKIGKILQRAIDQSIKSDLTPTYQINALHKALQVFQTSKLRKNSDIEDGQYQILITRDPYKVAEMSTNKPWSSCTRLGSCEGGFISHGAGINAHRLPESITRGLHVAYLINRGDYDLNNPLSRVSLVPYHGWAREGTEQDPEQASDMALNRFRGMGIRTNHPPERPLHTILRPSHRTYSSEEIQNTPIPDHFTTSVKELLHIHMPYDTSIDRYDVDGGVYADINYDSFGKDHDWYDMRTVFNLNDNVKTGIKLGDLISLPKID
jgi:hypothetical protein